MKRLLFAIMLLAGMLLACDKYEPLTLPEPTADYSEQATPEVYYTPVPTKGP